MADKTTRTADIHLRTEHQCFQVVDRFGRMIGASAYITQETYETLVNPTYSYSTVPAGIWFHVGTTATRDGYSYGASAPGKHFATLAEAEKHLTKYMCGAAKRALKVNGGVRPAGPSTLGVRA